LVRRFAFLVSVVLISAAAVIGCGGDGSSSSATTASTDTAATSTPTSTAPAPSPAETKKAAQAAEQVPASAVQLGSASEVPRSKGGDNSVQDFGSEANSADKLAVARVLTAYLGAITGGDAETACSLLSSQTAAGIERLAAGGSAGSAAKGCPAVLKQISSRLASSGQFGDLSHPRVLSVRVDGERGFIIFKGPKEVYNMPLVSESGVWKVAAIGPIPLQVQ
jgi:hypothetical protein